MIVLTWRKDGKTVVTVCNNSTLNDLTLKYYCNKLLPTNLMSFATER